MTRDVGRNRRDLEQRGIVADIEMRPSGTSDEYQIPFYLGTIWDSVAADVACLCDFMGDRTILDIAFFTWGDKCHSRS